MSGPSEVGFKLRMDDPMGNHVSVSPLKMQTIHAGSKSETSTVKEWWLKKTRRAEKEDKQHEAAGDKFATAVFIG